MGYQNKQKGQVWVLAIRYYFNFVNIDKIKSLTSIQVNKRTKVPISLQDFSPTTFEGSYNESAENQNNY